MAKTKMKFISISSRQFEKIAVQTVNLRLDDPLLLEESKKLVGKKFFEDQLGKGPFAYIGITNESKTIFIGNSVMDKNKGVVAFTNNGFSVLENLILQKSTMIDKAKAQRVEAEVYMNLPSQFEKVSSSDKNISALREMSLKMSSLGLKKVKSSFNERSKKLEIGTKGGRLLSIGFANVLIPGGQKEVYVQVKLRFGISLCYSSTWYGKKVKDF